MVLPIVSVNPPVIMASTDTNATAIRAPTKRLIIYWRTRSRVSCTETGRLGSALDVFMGCVGGVLPAGVLFLFISTIIQGPVINSKKVHYSKG